METAITTVQANSSLRGKCETNRRANHLTYSTKPTLPGPSDVSNSQTSRQGSHRRCQAPDSSRLHAGYSSSALAGFPRINRTPSVRTTSHAHSPLIVSRHRVVPQPQTYTRDESASPSPADYPRLIRPTRLLTSHLLPRRFPRCDPSMRVIGLAVSASTRDFLGRRFVERFCYLGRGGRILCALQLKLLVFGFG